MIVEKIRAIQLCNHDNEKVNINAMCVGGLLSLITNQNISGGCDGTTLMRAGLKSTNF